MRSINRTHQVFLELCLGCACAAPAFSAQTAESFDTGAGNLLVVLRESLGENKPDEALQPFGKVHATLTNGGEVELDTSWYRYLGDMHIRLVFDGGQSLQSATPQDLARLQLTPDQALELAVANLLRIYGRPTAQPWSGSLTQVQGGAADLDSSYFLDREFWRGVQAQYPEGVVAAVPLRGGLVYAPVTNQSAITGLRFSVAALYAGNPQARLSSALYLFKDGHWSVFQPPQASYRPQ